jgi:tetratricopeptide (TPR) repeat protein
MIPFCSTPPSTHYPDSKGKVQTNVKNRIQYVLITAMKLALCALLVQPSSAQLPDANDSSSPEVKALMDAGAASFKEAHYGEAVANFRKATQLEPGNENAHLYLAAAYAYQVVPNLDTPDNLRTASSALAEFDIVLRADPNDLTAIRQEASLYRNIKQFDQAKTLEKRAIAIDPRDVEALYTIGVLDWLQEYKNAVEILTAEGLTDNGVGNPNLSHSGCDALVAKNKALVDEGIASLTQAVELKPDFDDAMVYLQLTYRRHAEFHCGDPAGISADLKLAEEWNKKATQARKESKAAPQPSLK